MRVEFGWFLDRAPWAYQSPGLGAVRVGRKGLTDLLQTRLGTTRPETPHLTRVNQYAARLRAADRPDAWFHKSFAMDPWSTAQDLLAARDELVVNGWQGQTPHGATALLQTLAGLEQVGLPLAPAMADDVAGLISALDSPLPLEISDLELQHPRAALPQIWRQILDRLAARGVAITEPPPAASDGPRITILAAETEWEAAEHAARWLAADGTGRPTAVVASDSTAVLDHYLREHGAPRIGVSKKSAWRAHDQIIPLFMEVIWGPANVQLLGEFLSLPGSPVPRAAARALLKALAAEPGTGGSAWQEALEEISEHPKLGPETAAQMDALFSRSLLVDDGTVAGADIAANSAWLAGRLGKLASKNEAYKATSGQLQSLLALLAGLPKVSRQDLRRMVTSVVPTTTNPLAAAEASPWLRLNHLNELMDDVDDVLWWGFQSGTSAPGRRWEADDVDALAGIGIELPAPEQLAALAVTQSVHAATHAKNLLIVQTRLQNGEPTEPNPLLEALIAGSSSAPDDEIAGIADLVHSRTVTAAATTRTNEWSLAGRGVRLRAVSRQPVTPPPSSFRIHPRPELAPEKLSFSQLSQLLGCSLAWTLEKKARLSVPDAGSVPSGNTMIGTFVHKIVEELHAELTAVHRAVPGTAEVSAKFDQLVPQLASELLLPGNSSRLLYLRTVTVESVLKFFTTLSSAGITIQGTEEEFEKELPLTIGGEENRTSVTGTADVVGIDADGQRVVVDLKWTDWDKYRQSEVREGKAVQLALYQWALHDGDIPPEAPSAYYLLKQGYFASTSPSFGNPLDAPTTATELWQQTTRAAEFSIEEVLAGRIAAGAGLEAELAQAEETSREEQAEAAGRLYLKPPCRFCHFGTLCGVKGDFS